jgi:hypothetical protein
MPYEDIISMSLSIICDIVSSPERLDGSCLNLIWVTFLKLVKKFRFLLNSEKSKEHFT